MQIDLKQLTTCFIEETVVIGTDKYMKSYALGIEKNNNKDYVEFLMNNGVIDLKEKQQIIAMIYSPDQENYEIAKLILKNKSNELAKMSNMRRNRKDNNLSK